MSNPIEQLDQILLTEQQWDTVHAALRYVAEQCNAHAHSDPALDAAYLRGAADILSDVDDEGPCPQ